MAIIKRFASHFAAAAILFGLFAAPAFAIASTANDGHRGVSGAGFVLMVSLQRNAS